MDGEDVGAGLQASEPWGGVDLEKELGARITMAGLRFLVPGKRGTDCSGGIYSRHFVPVQVGDKGVVVTDFQGEDVEPGGVGHIEPGAQVDGFVGIGRDLRGEVESGIDEGDVAVADGELVSGSPGSFLPGTVIEPDGVPVGGWLVSGPGGEDGTLGGVFGDEGNHAVLGDGGQAGVGPVGGVVDPASGGGAQGEGKALGNGATVLVELGRIDRGIEPGGAVLRNGDGAPGRDEVVEDMVAGADPV